MVTASELVVLLLALTNEMSFVGPGFYQKKFTPQDDAYSLVQFIFLIRGTFFKFGSRGCLW